MNQKDFSRRVAERHDMTYRDATWAVQSVFETLANVFGETDKVTIQGFGVFKKVEHPKSQYRDINTGTIQTREAYNDVKLFIAPRCRAIVNGEPVDEEEEGL